MEYPETDEIEPEKAKVLYERHCAILILEDLPLGSEFGLDLFVYRIGQKFKGVKLIPPGVHFVYASAIEKNNSGQSGPRCGFIHDFKAKEILIKRWSTTEEDFDDSFCPSQEQQDRYQTNLRDLDRYLGAYKYSTYKTYLSLTNKLSPDIVQLLNPLCNRLRSVPYLTRDAIVSDTCYQQAKKPRSHSKLTEETLLPDLKPDQSTVIRFTKIPTDYTESRQTLSLGMVTQYNLDTTMKMEDTFNGEIGRQRLLAEFQFAFITFILYHVYDCFEHWKRLLTLVCLADTGLKKYPGFFEEFLRILASQTDRIPEDLFEDIVDYNNLVRCQLDILFQNIRDCSLNDGENIRKINNLLKSASDLRERLEDKFGWQFELEREDEQPVVVDL